MSKNIDLELIVDIMKTIVSKDRFDRTVALHEPVFQGNEWEYVKDCLDTGWVSSVGKYVDEFEKRLEDITGAKRAIAVVNGTAALQVCLKLAGVERDDEVLMPALTFIATANAASYLGAVPHFVDIGIDSLGLDPYKLDDYIREIAESRDGYCYNKITNRRIKAVVPMHTFGHPVDLDALVEVATRYNITIVEDAAESLGSYYKGKHTGRFGKLAAISFNGNKIITTGGGGAILTDDEELGNRVKHLITTAKIPHRWEYVHDEIGYNFRMPNINAALGCAQLESLDLYIERKRSLAEKYQQAFRNVTGVTFVKEPSYAKSNYWLNALLLSEGCVSYREKLLEITNSRGIMTRPAWKLMHKLDMYKNCPKMDLSISESIEERLINIPSSAFLGENND